MENENAKAVEEINEEQVKEPATMSFSEKVEPEHFKVEIKSEDWKPNGTIFECTVTVPGMYKDCICTGYINETLIKENASSKTIALKLINDIFANELLELKTDTYKIHGKFLGPAPKETIYIDFEVLPFLDCPAAKFGLDK